MLSLRQDTGKIFENLTLGTGAKPTILRTKITEKELMARSEMGLPNSPEDNNDTGVPDDESKNDSSTLEDDWVSSDEESGDEDDYGSFNDNASGSNIYRSLPDKDRAVLKSLYCPSNVDVRVPLQFMVKNSILSLEACDRSKLLGFYNPIIHREVGPGSQDNAPILFIRYAYRGAIFEVEFHDNENVLLPSPNAKDTGESFRPVSNEAASRRYQTS